jgi:hypothetical protein
MESLTPDFIYFIRTYWLTITNYFSMYSVLLNLLSIVTVTLNYEPLFNNYNIHAIAFCLPTYLLFQSREHVHPENSRHKNLVSIHWNDCFHSSFNRRWRHLWSEPYLVDLKCNMYSSKKSHFLFPFFTFGPVLVWKKDVKTHSTNSLAFQDWQHQKWPPRLNVRRVKSGFSK